MASKLENNIKVSPEKVSLETDQGIIESEERKWGLPLKEVYKHGFSFYKEKEGKAIHLSYEDRLKLVAYTQQIAHGPLDVNSAPPLGVLDVIGRGRRAAWQALGQMSQIQAMAGFVHTLDRLCVLFRPYLEAILKDHEAKEQQQLKKKEEERSHLELQNRIIEEKQKQQSNKLSEEQQVQRIKDALNAQTYDQFLQYSQQQYPGNFDQQAILIRQLQDQHYQQYIQQLAVDQRLANSNIRTEDSNVQSEDSTLRPENTNARPDNSSRNDNSTVLTENSIWTDNSTMPMEKEIVIENKDEVITDCNLNKTDITIMDNKSMQTSDKIDPESAEECRDDDSESEDVFPIVEEARMWTRPEIQAFRDSAQASGGKLHVGHGETVTVRVPTHHRARCLCWEFATDNYDIGFGLYFEWSKSPTTEVTVVVSESDEDDDNDDDNYEHDEAINSSSDPEIGDATRVLKPSRPPISLVVPIYRRDSHLEIYAGSHTYPGEGVYLLKFDNTYSLWRSKSLYYKVYYTQ